MQGNDGHEQDARAAAGAVYEWRHAVALLHSGVALGERRQLQQLETSAGSSHVRSNFSRSRDMLWAHSR